LSYVIVARINPEDNSSPVAGGWQAGGGRGVYVWSVIVARASRHREGTIVKTLWDSKAREEISQRVARLTPTTAAAWGKMNAGQMMAHVVDALRMAMGEIPVELKKSPIRFSPNKQLIIYGPPFPKGVPTSPELLLRETVDWSSECASLKTAMESFARRPASADFPLHPVFGKLSRRAWGALQYKHIDHHLKQFGV
jgi:hypothetical protein